MAYQGEYFVDRYGPKAAQRTPPMRRMLEMGVPIGAATDATRVASYNPFVSLYWMVTGKTLGGLKLYPEGALITREEALRLYTQGSAWMSREETKRGVISPRSIRGFGRPDQGLLRDSRRGNQIAGIRAHDPGWETRLCG
jgi:predicted amidohydrolase YtcJ